MQDIKDYDSHGITFQKNNIRPWGTYDLLVSIDGGTNWAMMNRPFGSRITESQAFTMVLTDNRTDVNFQEQLKNWLGNDRVDTLYKLIDTPDELPQLES